MRAPPHLRSPYLYPSDIARQRPMRAGMLGLRHKYTKFHASVLAPTELYGGPRSSRRRSRVFASEVSQFVLFFSETTSGSNCTMSGKRRL